MLQAIYLMQLTFALCTLKQDANGLGAGIRADGAAQMENLCRRVTDALFKRRRIFFLVLMIGHTDVIRRAFNHARLAVVDHRSQHLLVAAYLLDHLTDAVDQRKIGRIPSRSPAIAAAALTRPDLRMTLSV